MTETKPLLQSGLPGWHGFREIGTFAVVSLMFISASSGMSVMNKHCMRDDRFPFPAVLMLMHVTFISVVSAILYKLMPSLFTSLTNPVQAVTLDFDLIVKRMMPIAVLFSSNLLLNIWAYRYSDVTSIQMLKQGIVVLAYIWSIMLSLERFTYGQFGILVCIAMATFLASDGAIHFNWTGFVLQSMSMCCDSWRIVLQSIILGSGGNAKLDPFSYLMIVSPLCIAYLSFALVIGHQFLHVDAFMLPSPDDFRKNSLLLLGNVSLAFSLNLLSSWTLKLSSAVTTTLCGVTKDILVVVAGCVIFREAVGSQQLIAFCAQILLITLWSMTKIYPSHFSRWIPLGQIKEPTKATLPDSTLRGNRDVVKAV
eukprot:gnl/TRDRNA2_/TRDRNA2_180385_c0_seq1.p1 gnl/TRDRNA2_/TRDRNA2_180385_c0~~gnl/TRDRNA2_/TRDRNA2_180385_c0_seq1.p1  ORF type:complete len:367 (-),score=36.73 gnl/TRDRNA2_/TRDRNA2_180385_c0_seq1:131-1231(-)